MTTPRLHIAIAGAGIGEIRMDAAGYAIKRRGTSCFMLPETFEFITHFFINSRRFTTEVIPEMLQTGLFATGKFSDIG